jgi:transitional endoplasmic reticulum ATPase
MDEIDQSIRRGRGEGEGSGVSNRVFKRIMEFMSQTRHRGRVVFLAATNRPDLMDAALRRPGRFDKKIPFLIPGEEERKEIFKVMSRKYGGLTLSHIPEEVINYTKGWTGAEIEAAVIKAVELKEDEGLPFTEALVEAVQRVRPSTADIEMMTRLAIEETNDIDLLPNEYKRMLKVNKQMVERVTQKSVIAD